MGAGKTTIGSQLAKSLKCQFIDLDQYIEEKEGKTISEIFSSDGESKFRNLEENYLQDILEEQISKLPETLEDLPPINDNNELDQDIPHRRATLVISLGGGAVTSPICRELIAKFTYCIYIKSDIKTILNRLSEEERSKRPLLKGNSSLSHTIEELYKEREPFYIQLARKTIN